MTAQILIVDESELVRELYSVMLRGGGYLVRTAASAAEALALASSQQFDLIVSDLELTGHDGIDLIRNVRKTVGYADVPVILIAPLQDADRRLEGLRAGANVFVTKPTQTVDLVLHARLLLCR